MKIRSHSTTVIRRSKINCAHQSLQPGLADTIGLINMKKLLARTIHEMAGISRRDLFSQCLVFKYQVFLQRILIDICKRKKLLGARSRGIKDQARCRRFRELSGLVSCCREKLNRPRSMALCCIRLIFSMIRLANIFPCTNNSSSE